MKSKTASLIRNRFKSPVREQAMKKPSKNCGDKVLATLVILLALIVMFNMAFNYKDYTPSARRAASSASIGASPLSSAPLPSTASPLSSTTPQQVELTYLYADWCSYCTLTTPVVNSVVQKLGPAVSFHPYNEALRKTDPQVMALYTNYKARRLFVLFPTLVASGPKGETSTAGLMNETTILGWVCSQYTQPPAACK
jgi:thiol-disulfide isomerase/thioredoxin